MTIKRAQALLFILFFTLASTAEYVSVSLASCDICTEFVADIVNRDAAAPFAYRLLTPHIINLMGNTPAGIAAWHALMLFVFFGCLWVWLDNHGANALAGVALAALATIPMYQTYWQSIYTVTEWAFLALGLLLIQKDKPVGFGVLVLLATLNRQVTGGLLILFALTLYRRYLLAYLIVFASVVIGVRFAVGSAEHGVTPQGVLSGNLVPWRFKGAVKLVGILVPLLVGIALTPLAKWHLPIVIAVCYLPLFLIFGIWQEVRLLMPLLIVMLPHLSGVSGTGNRE